MVETMTLQASCMIELKQLTRNSTSLADGLCGMAMKLNTNVLAVITTCEHCQHNPQSPLHAHRVDFATQYTGPITWPVIQRKLRKLRKLLLSSTRLSHASSTEATETIL